MRRGDRILIIVLLAALAISFPLVTALSRRSGAVAVVTIGGRLVREIRLDQTEAPLEFRVDTPDGSGYNIIRVETGRIRVVEANCPEQVDVLQGWISHPGQSIICLPHRLVIRIKGRSDVDGIIR